MAISFELTAQSVAPVDDVFRTVADLRSWDSYAGVVLAGPERAVSEGDRIDISVKVMRRTISSGCVVRSITEPTLTTAGRVDIRSVDGPFDSRLIGIATPTLDGCDLSVEVYGIGRGAACMLERPLELIMQRWATHQMRHLLDAAAQGIAPASLSAMIPSQS